MRDSVELPKLDRMLVTYSHVKRVRYDVGIFAARLRVYKISFTVLLSIVPTTERFPLRRFI
ncbi:MAG: hypothetical protein ACRC62_13915, partial [Microcoleus sp.]